MELIPLHALSVIEPLLNFLKLIQKRKKSLPRSQLRQVKLVLILAVRVILNRKSLNLFIKFGKLNKRKKIRKKLAMI